MSLREKLFTALDQWYRGGAGPQLEAILPVLEEAITEAQAATVEWCLSVKPEKHSEHGFYAGEAGAAFNNAVEQWEDSIRALSPDPHAKDRWELEARLEEAKWWGEIVTHHEFSMDKKDCKLCQRVADLDRQLAVLGKEKP